MTFSVNPFLSLQLYLVMTEISESESTPLDSMTPWWRRLWDPCDVASVAFFRIAFAGIMVWHVARFLSNNWVEYYYVDSRHHLKYFGFEWVEPMMYGGAMRQMFYLMGFAAVGVGLGLFYRLSAITLFVTYTYSFLAEAALFQNHYYMMSLIAFLLVLIPAHRSFSLDALIFPENASPFIPNWCRWVLMLMVALPYVYGGIAKIDGDWLRAMPVGFWISEKSHLPVIGPYLTEHWVAWVVSYAGLILDLAIVPLLMWRKTRIPAYIVIVLFHVMNAALFNIDVFPWMMILLTTIFFAPDWPRRLLRLKPAQAETGEPPSRTFWQKASLSVVGLFVVWQLVFPLRHWAYPGNPSWTEEGHQFAWRMMLRHKEVFIRFYATDGEKDETVQIPFDRMLNAKQLGEMAISPDQIVATADYFYDVARKVRMKDVSIRAVVIASLNGRKPQLMIDPDLDLLTVNRQWGHQPWIKELEEPFRSEPWDVPSADWPEVLGIELPEAVVPTAPPPPGSDQHSHDHGHEGHDHSAEDH